MFHAINTLYCIVLFVTWNKQVKAFAYNSVYIFHLQKYVYFWYRLYKLSTYANY